MVSTLCQYNGRHKGRRFSADNVWRQRNGYRSEAEGGTAVRYLGNGKEILRRAEWRAERKEKMARPTTKADLLTAAAENYEKLNVMIDGLTQAEMDTPFDFSNSAKKEAHWKRDKNLRDVLIHLYEWHQLLLTWVHANLRGDNWPFIPKPYNWKTYGDMNVAFWKKHQETTLDEAKSLFAGSHAEVMALAETFSNEELFSKGVFAWVGGSTLGSYFVSNTSSHYDWAMKKLKAHKKNCAGK